jgi:hypothetical protein
MTLPVKAVLAWLVLLVLMFANGTLRVLVLQPRLGEETARQVASLTGLAIVLVASAAFVRFVPEGATGRQWLGVGLLWLALTLAFEFLFGHFVSGMSWAALLEDYDVRRGRLWVLVLFGTLLGPWACARLRGRRAGGHSE